MAGLAGGGLRQQPFADEDAGARLESWDEVAQDLYRVGVGPVVQDVPENVDVSGCLLGNEEVVSLERGASRCCSTRSLLGGTGRG
jgi:hypothetical protein